MFSFFLKCYRTDLLTFSGSNLDIEFNLDYTDAKFTFRKYDNGQFKTTSITTKHPNILHAVITAKKSLGLHIKMWSEGISDWCFTQEEILQEFSSRNIQIPTSILKDFNNQIVKAKQKRYI